MYKLLLCWRYLKTRYLAMACIISVTLGVATLRKGHLVLFILGFFMPLLWLIGGLIGPTPRAAGA